MTEIEHLLARARERRLAQRLEEGRERSVNPSTDQTHYYDGTRWVPVDPVAVQKREELIEDMIDFLVEAVPSRIMRKLTPAHRLLLECWKARK